MLKLVVHMAVRAVDESDLPKIAYELRKRIETQTALITDNVKVILVTGVEMEPEPALPPGGAAVSYSKQRT